MRHGMTHRCALMARQGSARGLLGLAQSLGKGNRERPEDWREPARGATLTAMRHRTFHRSREGGTSCPLSDVSLPSRHS